MNSSAPKKQQKGRMTEVVLTVMLFLFILAAIAFSVRFAVQMLAPSLVDEPTTPTPQVTTPSNGGDVPTPSNPIFQNGSVPTYPVKNDSTVMLDSVTPFYSQNAVIIEVESGAILAGKNTDAQFMPASMTKVMTLVVLCEKLTEDDLSKRLTLTAYYNNYYYNKMDTWLISGQDYIGDQIEIKDMLYGIGMVSAADCVLMLADYTYGSMEDFVDAMNEKAAALNLKNTHFGGASGDTAEENHTTAEDMAVVMAYAMQNELIRDILSTKSALCYSYYIKDGVETTRNRWLNSTLFQYSDKETSSRMGRYKSDTGERFTLKTVTDLAGKTGYLNDLCSPNTQQTNYRASTLAFYATGKTTGKDYVVIVNVMSDPDPDIFTHTMKDIKYLFDTYAT